jgi:hypothetical protein
MSPSLAQDEWISRVLGVARRATGAQQAGSPDPLSVWRDAKEEVDGRLSALARELRTYGDVDFDQIANRGLYGLTGGGQNVALMAALTSYNGAAGEKRQAAAAAVRKAVGAYQSFLQASSLVDVLDENPFDVEIGLFSTLNGALRQISASLP